MLILKHDSIPYGNFNGEEWTEWWRNSGVQFFEDRFHLNADIYAIEYNRGVFTCTPYIKKDHVYHRMQPFELASLEMEVEEHCCLYVFGEVEGFETHCTRCGDDFYWEDTRSNVCEECLGIEGF